MAQCPFGCGAEVKMVHTPGGRRMPLDAEPEQRIIVRASNGREAVGITVDTYRSHLASCPNAQARAEGGQRAA